MTRTRLAATLICCTVALALAGGAAADEQAPNAATPPAAAPGSGPAQPPAAVPDGADRPRFLLTGEGAAGGGACAPAAPGDASAPLERSTCVDCDSPQGYCSPGTPTCRNYCLSLVGEIGICSQECNCCLCPEVAPPPPDPGDPGETCQSICRCDGLPGPQGGCPTGCRRVNCVP